MPAWMGDLKAEVLWGSCAWMGDLKWPLWGSTQSSSQWCFPHRFTANIMQLWSRHDLPNCDGIRVQQLNAAWDMLSNTSTRWSLESFEYVCSRMMGIDMKVHIRFTSR